jgi:hypothetical protein
VLGAAAGVVLIASGFGAPVGAGLLAGSLAVGAAAGTYGVANGVANLSDRASHGESISDMGDEEVRGAWLGLTADALSIAALGSAVKLGKGGLGLLKSADEMGGAGRMLNGASTVADGAAMTDSTVTLARNWDKLSPEQRLMTIGQLGFWGTMGGLGARYAGKGLKNFLGGVRGQKSGNKELPEDFLLGDGKTLNPNYEGKVKEVFTTENLKYSSSRPTEMDVRKLQQLRDRFSSQEVSQQIDQRGYAQKVKSGKKSVTFAEVDIQGLPKELSGVSTEKSLGGENFQDVPPYISPQDRQLKSLEFEGSPLQPAADGEAKIAEYIFRNTDKSTKGTIRIVTDRPACDSCAYVLSNLARERPGLNIEVIETQRQR